MFGENKEMSERCFDYDKIIASSELFVKAAYVMRSAMIPKIILPRPEVTYSPKKCYKKRKVHTCIQRAL